MKQALEAYEPLNTLKSISQDIWIVDGAEIRMPIGPLAIPFTTRMTVVRLSSGRIWLHSPIGWQEALANAIEELGAVSYIVAPNGLHHLYVAEWQRAYPGAKVFMAPGLEKKGLSASTLDDSAPSDWAGEIEQVVAFGGVINEMVFFHRSSQTLILTDPIENFEPGRVRSRFWRFIMRLVSAMDPDGKAPLDLQLSFIRHRKRLRKVVQRMIAWEPERVILAHGRCYEKDGVGELRRAFRWIL